LNVVDAVRGIDYWRWRIERIYMLVLAQAYVGPWLSSFKELPPRMKPGGFSLEKVMVQVVARRRARQSIKTPGGQK
jgi:hypothetical protein